MKTHRIFLSIIFLLVASVGLAQAQYVSSPALNVNVVKYNPTPAEAGNFLEVFIGISNTGSAYANNLVLEVVPEFPFSLDAGESATREFPVIDNNGAVTKYRLRVDPDSPNGDTQLKVRRYTKNSRDIETKLLNISVLAKADLVISSVEPVSLKPGQLTKVNLTIKNTGNAPLNDLIVSWTDSSGKILSIAGDNKVRVKQIPVGQSTDVQFNMIADLSIIQGVHTVNINTTFLRFGTVDSRTSQIAFIVGGLTDFDLAQQEVEDGTVSLSVANVGVNIGTAVSVSVPQQDGWEIVGSSSVFLGNLNPGDFTVGSLQVRPTLETSSRNLKVKIEYTDTVGIRQSLEKEININFAQAMQKKKSSETSPAVYVIVILVVLGAVWFFDRRFNILRRILRRK